MGEKKNPFGKNTPLDELPNFISTGRIRGWRSFDGRYRQGVPINKYLQSREGEDWDDVLNDIRMRKDEFNCPDPVDAAGWQVLHRTWVQNGEVWCNDSGVNKPIEDANTRWDWRIGYVHPETHQLVLFQSKRRKWRWKRWPKDTTMIEPSFFCKKIYGVWYGLIMERLPPPYETWEHTRYTPHLYRVVDPCMTLLDKDTRKGKSNIVHDWRHVSQNDLIKLYGIEGIYCVSMKQLNKKQIKQYKLRK